jgi:hypothetical protein
MCLQLTQFTFKPLTSIKSVLISALEFVEKIEIGMLFEEIFRQSPDAPPSKFRDIPQCHLSWLRAIVIEFLMKFNLISRMVFGVVMGNEFGGDFFEW